MIELYGKDAQAEAGRSFEIHATAWEVVTVFLYVCDQWKGGKLLTEEVLGKLAGCQVGDALENQSDCDRLAGQMEFLLAHPAMIREFGLGLDTYDGEPVITMDGPLLADSTGRVYSSAMVSAADAARLQLRSAHFVKVERIRELIAFLKACHGFVLA